MTRGWTSYDLAVVEDDDTLWNVVEAAVQLGTLPGDPEDTPLTATVGKLRDLVRLHRLTPAGKRRSSRPGHPGRYARVYHAADLIALYERLDFEGPSTSVNNEKPPVAA